MNKNDWIFVGVCVSVVLSFVCMNIEKRQTTTNELGITIYTEECVYGVQYFIGKPRAPVYKPDGSLMRCN